MTLSDFLRKYNKWRRGDERIKQPNPTQLGKMIDAAANRLDVLEDVASKAQGVIKAFELLGEARGFTEDRQARLECEGTMLALKEALKRINGDAK
jgi:hypothetical protein